MGKASQARDNMPSVAELSIYWWNNSSWDFQTVKLISLVGGSCIVEKSMVLNM
jgi:hypothetical protein